MAFPNIKGKHDEKAIINPSEYMKYAKRTGYYPDFKPPKAMIMCYRRSLMKYVIANHKTTKVKWLTGDTYLLDETNGEVGIIGNFGIGAPLAATVLEEFIAFGVERFISIGTAGTLQKHIGIGQLIVCDKAIRDEGTSHHYIKPSKYAHASAELTRRIVLALESTGQEYSIGTSWTTDAPYRETVKEARQYQKEGVLTVEMEASALFAVAKCRKVEIGAIFTASDSLAELEWKPRFKARKTEKGLETIYRIALLALK